jgi:hypothetical protein
MILAAPLLLLPLVWALDSRWSRRFNATHGKPWCGAVRLGLAASTAAVVVAGHLWVQISGNGGRIDLGFVGLLMLDLLPVGIFTVGARRPSTIVVSGFSIFVLTQLGWLLWVAERDDALAGVGVMCALFLNLILSTVAAAMDRSA